MISTYILAQVGTSVPAVAQAAATTVAQGVPAGVQEFPLHAAAEVTAAFLFGLTHTAWHWIAGPVLTEAKAIGTLLFRFTVMQKLRTHAKSAVNVAKRALPSRWSKAVTAGEADVDKLVDDIEQGV